MSPKSTLNNNNKSKTIRNKERPLSKSTHHSSNSYLKTIQNYKVNYNSMNKNNNNKSKKPDKTRNLCLLSINKLCSSVQSSETLHGRIRILKIKNYAEEREKFQRRISKEKGEEKNKSLDKLYEKISSVFKL